MQTRRDPGYDISIDPAAITVKNPQVRITGREPATTMLKTVKVYAKKSWNWLTSMRTALALLFLLAIAAIPGALLPQRSLNESNVIEYLQSTLR